MLFDKKRGVLCKHLVFSDTVLYNNEVCQLGYRIKHIMQQPEMRLNAMCMRNI